MTTYSDYSDYSDTTDFSETFEDTDLSADGCCCGPEVIDAAEPSSSWTEDVIIDGSWGLEDLTSTDEVAAPATYEPAAPAPVDASMVIPAGQPGGYSVPAVVDLDGQVDWHTSGSDVEHLYPSVGTIGGNQLGAMTITPGDDAVPSFERALNTIGGGDPYGAITITSGADTPAVSATSATIGQAQPSNLDLLGSLYGMAGDTGDILTQATLLKTIAATQAVTAPYTSPL